jgi:hypothetical protein
MVKNILIGHNLSIYIIYLIDIQGSVFASSVISLPYTNQDI